MPDRLCGVILTREELRLRNKGVHPSRRLRYGDKCDKHAKGYFRIEHPNGPPVLLSRCESHCENVSHAINDKVVTRLTHDEAIVSEVHDA
jgi:hypothetical protein